MERGGGVVTGTVIDSRGLRLSLEKSGKERDGARRLLVRKVRESALLITSSSRFFSLFQNCSAVDEV